MTQKLYIPRLGDILTLTDDWTFLMHNEKRNSYFFKILPDALNVNYWNSKVLSKEYVESERTMAEIYERIVSETGAEFYRLYTQTIESSFGRGTMADDTFVSKEYISEEPETKWYFKNGGKRNTYRVKYLHHPPLEDYKFTFPKGTKLLVKRIYIRRGAPDFDSVTFSAQNGPHKGKTFWCALDDVNYIEFE
jgi:hypothetical protein